MKAWRIHLSMLFFYIEFMDVFKFVFIEYDQQIEPDLRLS